MDEHDISCHNCDSTITLRRVYRGPYETNDFTGECEECGAWVECAVEDLRDDYDPNED